MVVTSGLPMATPEALLVTVNLKVSSNSSIKSSVTETVRVTLVAPAGKVTVVILKT